jgi:hypothetical protein
MNGITNDASQHHPTEQGSVQTVENNKKKAGEGVSLADEGVQVPGDPTDQRVSDMEARLKKRKKKEESRRGRFHT